MLFQSATSVIKTWQVLLQSAISVVEKWQSLLQYVTIVITMFDKCFLLKIVYNGYALNFTVAEAKNQNLLDCALLMVQSALIEMFKLSLLLLLSFILLEVESAPNFMENYFNGKGTLLLLYIAMLYQSLEGFLTDQYNIGAWCLFSVHCEINLGFNLF